jgi:predicted site-specific integrase-resolvase
MNAAIYARVSTRDKGQDFTNQLIALREFAAKPLNGNSMAIHTTPGLSLSPQRNSISDPAFAQAPPPTLNHHTTRKVVQDPHQ